MCFRQELTLALSSCAYAINRSVLVFPTLTTGDVFGSVFFWWGDIFVTLQIQC
jgi:hypothetical protein